MRRVIAVGVSPSEARASIFPSEKRFMVHSINFTYTCSGTAGNRQMMIRLYDHGDNIIASYPANGVLIASTTAVYTFSPVGVMAAASIVKSEVMPSNMFLEAKHRIEIFDAQAVDLPADNIRNVFVVIEEVDESGFVI